jgi:serine protease Do
MQIKPFYVGTCKNITRDENPLVFDPILKNPFKPFLIQDPFGLRKAIVPVFRRDMNGEIYGMGTAFHIDGWGTFLTADHVIDFAREHPLSASSWAEISPNPNGNHTVLLLGMGLVIGEVNIPKEAFALVEHMESVMGEKHNPFTNRTEPENISDLAIMKIVIPSESQKIPQPHFISIRVSGSYPSIGDTVLAIGFPELECQRLDSNFQGILLNEGMYGAYGLITAIHSFGRDESTPTPVFEVECNWLPGMSGGPVFNSSGEVIGLVSRAMEVSSDELGNGVGWATCFSSIPYLGDLVPTLDPTNPRWRRGWAVVRPDPWHLAGFLKLNQKHNN